MNFNDEKQKFIDYAKSKLSKFISNNKINIEEVNKLLNNALDKIKAIPEVEGTLSYIKTFVCMIRDYIKKEYTDLSMQSIVIMLFAIFYVLNPIDLIPGFILIFGKLDDVIVITFCLKLIEDDVEKYKQWQLEKMKSEVDEMDKIIEEDMKACENEAEAIIECEYESDYMDGIDSLSDYWNDYHRDDGDFDDDYDETSEYEDRAYEDYLEDINYYDESDYY